MSDFRNNVIRVVSSVPKGKVVSYGQVASYVGLPRAAREVGWVMSELGEVTPWWRVVNNKGFISIRGNLSADKERQASLLIMEGVPVDEDFKLPIDEYRFRPTEKELKEFQLENTYIRTLIEKYGV
jgi:methylated-DNA-protein-cysteine methyltransferase-like protein